MGVELSKGRLGCLSDLTFYMRPTSLCQSVQKSSYFGLINRFINKNEYENQSNIFPMHSSFSKYLFIATGTLEKKKCGREIISLVFIYFLDAFHGLLLLIYAVKIIPY